MAAGQWAGWDHDHRISGYWAPKIRAADRRIIPTGKVADTHPGGGLERARMVARSAIDAAGVGKLAKILTSLGVDGEVFGVKTGLGQVRDAGMSSPVPPPGLVGALGAAKTRNWAMGPGLHQHVDPVTLLGFERRADKVAREVAKNLGDGVAKILAAGWERGDSTDTIARALAVFVDNPGRAETIAITETARSMVAGSLDTYERNGIAAWDWLVSPGACPICLSRAAGGPYGLNDEAPPGHPRCRCATVPVVDVPNISLSPMSSLGGLPGMGGVGGISDAGGAFGGAAGIITSVLTSHPGWQYTIDTSGLTGDDEDEG